MTLSESVPLERAREESSGERARERKGSSREGGVLGWMLIYQGGRQERRHLKPKMRIATMTKVRMAIVRYRPHSPGLSVCIFTVLECIFSFGRGNDAAHALLREGLGVARLATKRVVRALHVGVQVVEQALRERCSGTRRARRVRLVLVLVLVLRTHTHTPHTRTRGPKERACVFGLVARERVYARLGGASRRGACTPVR